jgi:hypothetical protein
VSGACGQSVRFRHVFKSSLPHLLLSFCGFARQLAKSVRLRTKRGGFREQIDTPIVDHGCWPTLGGGGAAGDCATNAGADSANPTIADATTADSTRTAA